MHSHVITSAASLRFNPPPLEAGAGFGIRFAAWLLDYGVLFIVGTGSALLTPMLFGPAAPLGALLTFAASLVADLVFRAGCEAWGGGTPGKQLLGLRVVNEQGDRITFVAGLIRAVGFYVDGFFFGIVAWNAMQRSPLQQRYGDSWAKTVVVSRDEPGIRVHRAAGVVAGAIAAAVVLDVVVRFAGAAIAAG